MVHASCQCGSGAVPSFFVPSGRLRVPAYVRDARHLLTADWTNSDLPTRTVFTGRMCKPAKPSCKVPQRFVHAANMLSKGMDDAELFLHRLRFQFRRWDGDHGVTIDLQNMWRWHSECFSGTVLLDPTTTPAARGALSRLYDMMLPELRMTLWPSKTSFPDAQHCWPDRGHSVAVRPLETTLAGSCSPHGRQPDWIMEAPGVPRCAFISGTPVKTVSP